MKKRWDYFVEKTIKIFKMRKEMKICTMVVTYQLPGKAIIKALIGKSTEKCLDPLQNVQPKC